MSKLRPILFLASALLLAGCVTMYGYRPLKSFDQKKCDIFLINNDKTYIQISEQ